MLANTLLPLGLAFRELRTDDQVFVETLFSSTRDYFYQLPLPKLQVDLLIKQQFQMQQASYLATYPSAETYIIELHANAVGKIIVNNTNNFLHIVDMVLVNDMRGKGLGSAILRTLKKVSEQQLRALRLAVDQQNIRAKKLYLELGFMVVESSATHDTLMWR